MVKVKIKPYNVVDQTQLPAIIVERKLVEGDPLEIDRQMYYVCETGHLVEDDLQEVGVIPLVVRNPVKVANIKSYIDCLSTAHKRIQFRKENNICDFNDCDEMIIS